MLRDLGFEVLALTPSPDAEDVRTVAVRPRQALLVGSEGDGLTEEALAAADRRVRIAMAPGVDSLNVATAAAVALHHLARHAAALTDLWEPSDARGAARVSQSLTPRRAVPGEEPALPLLGRAVGEGLGVDLAVHLLLDPVVADGGGGVEPVLDVLLGEILDEAGVDGATCPHAGQAVGLELDPDPGALRTGVVAPCAGRASR